MSGGSKKKSEPVAASTPTPVMQPVVIPQAMPGQLEAIASQLSAGFGGSPAQFMAQMDQVYSPVDTSSSMAAVAPAAAAQPAANDFLGRLAQLRGQPAPAPAGDLASRLVSLRESIQRGNSRGGR